MVRARKPSTSKAPTASPLQTKSATLADVARVAGVSCSAAGLVLNGGTGNTRCSKETAERIRKTAQKLGYHPNHAARVLSGKRSHLLGLLVASAGDPLRSFLVEYLDTATVKMGCHTIIGNTIVSPGQFDYYIEEFARRGVDGVFCTVWHWYHADRAALLARHPNTVFYDDPELPGAAYVTVDREEAVRIAVRHLAEKGRKRIGLAVMTLAEPMHKARLRGYESELAVQNLPLEEQLVFNGQDYGLVSARCDDTINKWRFPAKVMDIVVDSLVGEGKADAIVAHDDFWAATLIKALRSRGIRVPQDVAVIGFLNHYLADWTDPALTTIDLQHKTAAETMVRMLEEMIENGPLPEDRRVVTIQPKLVIRESG